MTLAISFLIDIAGFSRPEKGGVSALLLLAAITFFVFQIICSARIALSGQIPRGVLGAALMLIAVSRSRTGPGPLASKRLATRKS